MIILKYKLIGNNDTSSIIETVLKNRGIENWRQYIELYESNKDTYKNLSNIEEAVEMFDKHFQIDSPIAILVDNDVDGISSATIMYKYIKR